MTFHYAKITRAQLHFVIVSAAAFIVLFLMPGFAQAAGMPWESGMCRAAQAIGGPWLGWVAVIAIVIAAVAFGVGELNGPLKEAMTIVAGLSIAISASSVVGWFWPNLLNSAAC